MKLLRMTATFGRLEQETLSLTEGLNVLQMPNEAGKSTWAEFLLAMLYGIDTSEREKTGVLPVKTKYQPWSGKPMEGVIELEHAGRRITLTRTSTARAPLGVFSAVYTDSGLPVEGMTGANCGETLLGVPKRVYQRSAFVRQAGLGLTPDDELEARLSALVTTGDEAVSFAAADKRLLAWQNRVRHNKTGLIPDAERELAAVDSALTALAGEHEKNLALRAQLQSLQAQQTACEEDLRALQAAQAQRKKAQLYDAKRAAMQAANRENAASAVCARLPREDALLTLSQEAASLLSLPELEAAAAAPARPDCPQAFSGVDEERLLDKAQRDMREFDRLTAKKHRPSVPFWVLAALFAGLGAAGWFVRHEPLIPAAFALAALAYAVIALVNAAHDRRREAELSEAQALLTLYENHSRDEFYAVMSGFINREARRPVAYAVFRGQLRGQIAHAPAVAAVAQIGKPQRLIVTQRLPDQCLLRRRFMPGDGVLPVYAVQHHMNVAVDHFCYVLPGTQCRSMASAAPSSSQEAVTSSASARISGHAFAMATPIPAILIMLLSFSPSPIAIVAAIGRPR